MIKLVSGTILARILITVMGLLVSVIAGHALGAAGLGTIGLIVLGITLVRMLMEVVGGSALVYLVPRVPLRKLLWPCYLWAAVAALAGFLLVSALDLVPSGYAAHVVFLALIQSMNAVHLNVMIGQQRILANNLVTVVQATALTLAFILFSRDPASGIPAFIYAAYCSGAVALVLSTWTISRKHTLAHPHPMNVMRLLLRQGAYVQGANGMQLMNYRLAYWLIEKFQSTAALGIYTVANQLAEGSWLVPKSLALVLYSKISNSRSSDEQRLLTLTFLKIAMAFTLAVLAFFLLLPGQVYQWAFGPEVTGITPLIALLAPGIMAMAASQAFSHFFSGTARNVHNVIGSGLGLVATVVAGLLLIPAYGLPGAAIAATLAYCANALYQMVAFMRITGSSFKDLWPNAADGRRLREMLFSGRPLR